MLTLAGDVGDRPDCGDLSHAASEKQCSLLTQTSVLQMRAGGAMLCVLFVKEMQVDGEQGG